MAKLGVGFDLFISRQSLPDVKSMLAGGRGLRTCNGNGLNPSAGSGPLKVTASMSPADSTSRVHPWGRAQPPWAPPALVVLFSSQGQCWQPLRHGWVGRLSSNADPMSQPCPKGCDAAKFGAALLSPPHQGTVPLSPLSPVEKHCAPHAESLSCWAGEVCNGFGDQQEVLGDTVLLGTSSCG